ncbi:pyrroline-5-carboxylate reductase 2 [Lepeophtheirus salmonis]|uniref:pyrroline-5-carboxylate reductase 2 n=1 Tax=Lepeophtheirus salmonis TaxID=72036 RepID=UPI001AE74862|nr:pyrroline-5-carboxylate reductase 2-like [Lepeophtheirus salmonis]XP_040580944.1 pyrroline-5-carboxylate reductase 2-like [Lepeophtheirus salmonis]XP_040580945.1 pyrroline-5-carboxylate reductase 2-like [Lepeophtheirus salmonis]XP_040580947.1 pyrroline-5-carboxylate reductase 2-like [Lepeophtheirus salmonis]
MRIGFIGAGKMALALARGFSEKINPTAVLASCPPSDDLLLKQFRDHGFDTYNSNEFVARNSDVVIFATKPFVFPIIMKELKHVFTVNQLLISIAAGLKINLIEKSLKDGDKLKIMRVMPNTPSLVNEGVTVYAPNKQCKSEEEEIVERLFSSVGRVYKVNETQIDAVTGISGSGPAYMFLIIEAMADAGVRQGLPRDFAYKLAAQTMVGAGRMVLETGDHPAVLKDAVCSPAGSTIEALDTLEKNGMRSSIMKAVEAATNRCKELGN